VKNKSLLPRAAILQGAAGVNTAIYLLCNRSRENRIFVTASEAKQSNIVERLRLLRPKGLAMTQKRHIYCVNAYPTFIIADKGAEE
jgi:hypothetical protein